MNGALHLGHGFSLSKAEFSAGYQWLLNKKVLFPFGFHCTGMPIKASADKLKKEISLYGNPPIFPIEDLNDSSISSKDGITIPKHSKVAAKTGTIKYQWQIMQSLGIPDEIISNFTDTEYWIKYFPPVAEATLRSLGCRIDWRRKFVTTNVNPFYDSFVRWQFNKLKQVGKIKFGKRNTIFSPLDNQPCLDHDRASGEGVECKEYVAIKLKLINPFPEKLQTLQDELQKKDGKKRTICIIAATLRPETMYGQTNCWVGPDLDYSVFQVSSLNVKKTRENQESKEQEESNQQSHQEGSSHQDEEEEELFICTSRSFRNMKFQEIKSINDSPLATLKGSDLVGGRVNAPLSIHEQVWILPLLCISANKGTGIVTSVPSNSPDDYAAMRDLIQKEALRKKYEIHESWLLNSIPIIFTEDFGDSTAAKLYQQLGIKSQNDRDLLEKAKEIAYKEDFYKGKMLVGPYAGESVIDAKGKIRQQLIDDQLAFVYWEPESVVISRSGDECVVALTDQWYLDYGEIEWREQAKKCLSRMQFYSDDALHQFQATLDWMQQWACSRSFGLGTRLPWDPDYLIESLSDSTIYMAYYTVCHLIQRGSLRGENGKWDAQSFTDNVWDYIFGCTDELPISDSSSSPSTFPSIPIEDLCQMRREFEYFYPMDLRVSGKDLIPNHLTMMIYNHVAIFPEKYWPKGIRANGHLLLNSQKMSKSTGNFMTLEQSIKEFGATATRIGLADSGDGLEDANFVKNTANAVILKLSTHLEFISQVFDKSESQEEGADVNESQEEGIKGEGVKEGKKKEFRESNSNFIENDKERENQDNNFESNQVWADCIFEAELNKTIESCKKAYELTQYREVIKIAFFDLLNSKDRYRDMTILNGREGMNRNLLKRFIRIQAQILSPIIPHYSEWIWRFLMGEGEDNSIMKAGWPNSSSLLYENILKEADYINKLAHGIRLAKEKEMESKSLKKKSNNTSKNENESLGPIFKVILTVANGYPSWQEQTVQIIKELHDQGSLLNENESGEGKDASASANLVSRLKNLTIAPNVFKKVVPFAMEFRNQLSKRGNEVFNRTLGFDESQVIKKATPFLASTLKLEEIEIIRDDQMEVVPGEPIIKFSRKILN